MICKATLEDIDKILQLTKACATHMVDIHIYQWNAFYPNKQAFLKDIERYELYVLKLENKLIGCITISTFIDEEYLPITWLTLNINNIYIHRLAIHPKEQSKGYAQQLMQFAEDFAKKNEYTSIRLDTFYQNRKNQKFYELRGYKRLVDIFFPKQSKHSFYCYELVL